MWKKTIFNFFSIPAVMTVLLVCGNSLAQNPVDEVPAEGDDGDGQAVPPVDVKTEPAATEPETSADPPKEDPEATCDPACRPGFACLEGVCKSLCNPPCNAGELCTVRGHCIPSKINIETEYGVQLIQAQAPFVDTAHWKYNLRKYDEFNKQRISGVVLIVTGAVMTVTGIAFLMVRHNKVEDAANNDSYGEPDDGKPFLFVGWGMGIVGALMGGGGFATYRKSEVGMTRAEEGFFDPPQIETIRPDSQPVPNKGKSTVRGLSLRFRF